MPPTSMAFVYGLMSIDLHMKEVEDLLAGYLGNLSVAKNLNGSVTVFERQ